MAITSTYPNEYKQWQPERVEIIGDLYRIMARLSEQDQTFWTLKWGNK